MAERTCGSFAGVISFVAGSYIFPSQYTRLVDFEKINVRVGTGKVPVPNVVGKTQSEAQTIIAAANLQVQTSFKQTNDVPEGTVISQSPKSGTVDLGGTIKIVVAQKAAPTLTPTTVTPTPTPSGSTSPTVPPSP